MALLADRVKETTTTTGTGTVSLAGAPAGFQSFNTAFANGSLVYYVIQGGAEWEIGIGTTGTGTLARTTVLQSSNADALVPFSAGVKDVFCSYVADRAVTTVDAATLTNKTLDDYTNNIGANSTHFRIKATGTLSKGTVVKATGYNPGENAIEVAVVTSATDLVLGISEQALTAGQFGLAVVIGELFDVNTNGFTVGNIIYSNGAGGFTETKPTSGLYQALGWIVRANTNNGVIAVNVVAPLYVETATNTANTSVLRDGSGNFAAGTITATLSGTATQVSNALTAGTYLTSGGTYNGSAARTFAVDATDANTASKVVARDASGNFSAGTITATLNGAAPAGSLSGTTLASGVTASSLTSVGTLSSLTVSGNVTVDTNTMFVDSANNRVGIGTASPAYALDLASGIARFDSSAGDGVRVYGGSGTNQWDIYANSTNLRFSDNTGGGSVVIDTGATIGGNLAVDTNTLYVDAANNRVGVGTASPTATLHMVAATGDGTSNTHGARFNAAGNVAINVGANSSVGYGWIQSANWGSGYIATAINPNGGNVGIGTASPTEKVEVSASNVMLKLNADTDSFAQLGYYENGALKWNVYNDYVTDEYRIGNSSGTLLSLTASGNLGLGVTPSAWASTSTTKAFEIGTIGNAIFGQGTDSIAVVSNAYYDGAWKYANSATASRYQQDSAKHIWYTAPSGTAGNAITFTQAMTLDASGYLAIGTTTTTSARVNIQNDNAINEVVFRGTDYTNILSETTGGMQIGISSTTGTPALAFLTANSERARITSGGYFKASNDGTYYSSTGALHEFRQSAGDNQTIFVHNTAATLSGSGARGILINYTAAPNAADRGFLACFDGNVTTERATIRSNGGLANYQSNNVDLSDARTKTDITPAASMWSKIGALEIVTYKYIDQTHDDVNVGVIAQQVEAVEPVWVDADGMGETPADGVPLKTVYTKDITFAAIKALQEAMARIETLEQRVLALEA